MASRAEQMKSYLQQGSSNAPTAMPSSPNRVDQMRQYLQQPNSAPAPEPEKKPGFFKRAFKGVGKGIVKDLIEPATVGLVKTPLQGLTSLFRGVQATPDVVRGVFGNKQALQKANETMAKPIAGIKPLQGMTPTEAATGPLLDASLSLIGARGTASRMAESLASKQAVKAEQKALQEAVDVVREPLTKLVKERAIQEGRVATKGALKQTVINPSQREQDIAEVVKGIVSKKNTPVQNVQAIKGKIAQVAEEVGSGLKENNAIFNRNQLKTVIGSAKEESRVVFGSEKTIENTYDAVVDEFMETLEKHPKNLSGLWAARKEFDTKIEQKLPNIFKKFGRDDVRANAVQDVRRSVNDYIADALPEGNPFKEKLKQMNLMFEAQNNIKKKGTTEIGKNAIDRFGDKHPLLKKAAKTTAKLAIPAAGISAGYKLFK